MVLDAVSNFVRGNTDASVGTSDTTVSVADASIFPDPATDGEFNVVIWDVNNFPRPDQDGDVEIMRVTERDTTADELTVTRGQEMTSAAAHPEGSAIHLSPTAKMFSDIESTFGDFWDAGTQELTADVNNTNTTTQTFEAETASVAEFESPKIGRIANEFNYSNEVPVLPIPDAKFVKIQIQEMNPESTSDIFMQFSSDSGDTWFEADYDWVLNQRESDGTVKDGEAEVDSSILLAKDVGSGGNWRWSPLEIEFSEPRRERFTQISYRGNMAQPTNVISGGGGHIQTEEIDALRLFAGGSVDALDNFTGRVIVYPGGSE